jgi:hypothetical protein
MFSLEQRDLVRQRLLRLAEEDEHVVAAAEVGSLALGGGDRWSDIDLTFAVGGSTVGVVLEEWTRHIRDEFDGTPLVDLARDSTTYRVFLLPDELQVDLSATPAGEFRPAGPRFRLLFGETMDAASPAQASPDAAELFGWGVIYGIHARRCIARERPWQAEHYINATRDHALMLACLRNNLPVVQARGYDDLPSEVLAGLADTRVGSLHVEALRAAFAAAMSALLREAADQPQAAGIASRLDALD